VDTKWQKATIGAAALALGAGVYFSMVDHPASEGPGDIVAEAPRTRVEAKDADSGARPVREETGASFQPPERKSAQEQPLPQGNTRPSREKIVKAKMPVRAS